MLSHRGTNEYILMPFGQIAYFLLSSTLRGSYSEVEPSNFTASYIPQLHTFYGSCPENGSPAKRPKLVFANLCL